MDINFCPYAPFSNKTWTCVSNSVAGVYTEVLRSTRTLRWFCEFWPIPILFHKFFNL